MTIWEKVILNIRRGSQRVAIAAALVAERARAELTIVRLRIRHDEVNATINELYQGIGRRVKSLATSGTMPKTCELLLQDEEITSAFAELIEREKEIEELNNEIRSVQVTIKTAPKQRAEGSA